ncbi:MAG: hypothetical protein A3H52_02690 [Candidatus Zambryskibacteria bacterium RIFCSPLOWO2_02_FULL_39_26]|uniref:SHS2 domain-containing protein n=1 Tax=Candidatus Zambryskibacteria bacterium RIFCSPLOWO2_12_FULL_39_23 TaxID=1802776 RepID=A0A1G2UTR0_9BACT|nr:MAG: hypothetical protein A2W51_01250 [Candidatus Zambryskibacteria bacterium RIFCSPHIGHO2_02_39_10]OHB10361.1 MAG: hypothetical protein A3H52_02690 [Candidatus Zambryskibacteria bacterium RIFCSPLOWO2_02_FULL_39_26]OHB12738.1 MAG: hypothetical protein A3G99_01555 [Candidatus Zambryskibacteria bacterium RIFCSPLOWO2_12_FULL_39_23]
MSILSFFRKKEDELSILLDIGNGSINGAIVLFTKNKIPRFIFTGEVPFSIPLQPSAPELSAEMKILLNKILDYLIKNGLSKMTFAKKIEKVLVTFSSPWFALKTKHINLVQQNYFLITKDFLDDIIEKEKKVFEKLLSGEDSPNKSFEIVEKSIVHTKINGYEMSNSLGRKTKNFDAYLCLSVVGKSTIDIVHNAILKNSHIPADMVSIHTFPVVSFIVVRDIFSANSDFIIMDITGEVTDLTLVEDNVVIKSISMPSGRNFIIRQIAKKLDLSAEIAESNLHLYAEGKLDEKTKIQIQTILLDVEKEWSIYLESAIQEFSSQKNIPSTVYLTVDSDVAPIYKDFLSLVKTDSTAEFRKNMNLIHINKETLSHFYETQMEVEVNEFMAILAVFYNKLFQDK